MLKIPMILSSYNSIVLNFSATVKFFVVVSIVPEDPFTFLVSRYSAGLPPSVEYTVMSVGS